MRILLVDDHRTFLAGTGMILEKHGFSVTPVSGGQEAIELMQHTDYDLYLFDLKLPGMNGFELTEQALKIKPEAMIVILTGEEIEEHYDRLIDLGVAGILEKSIGEHEFIASLKLAMNGLIALPLALARKLRTGSFQQAPAMSASGSTLTEKELGVLKLIAQGCKNKDIADRLFMSQRNVEYAISHLFTKLNVNSRQDAVLKGIELNWLKLDSGTL